MCEPATIAYTVMAVATVAQGYSAYQQGRFENEMSKYNARVDENAAQREREAGTEEEMAHRRKAAALLGEQRAQFGASGVDVASGSALQIQQDTMDLAEADALRIRRNTDDKVQARLDRAKLTRAEGKAAASGGKTALGISLLSAAGSFAASPAGSKVSSKWFGPKSAASQGGAFGGSQINDAGLRRSMGLT